MMETIKSGVLSGRRFGDDLFPIIQSLMFFDGTVLRREPRARRWEDMRPFAEGFPSTEIPEPPAAVLLIPAPDGENRGQSGQHFMRASRSRG